MSEKIHLPGSKKPVYNGTHGNASTHVVNGKVTASKTTDIVLAELDVGVIPIHVQVHLEALGSSAKASVELVSESDQQTIIPQIAAAAMNDMNSDMTPWFPTTLMQEKYSLVLRVENPSVVDAAVMARIQTISQGNL